MFSFYATTNSYFDCTAINPTSGVSCGAWFRQTASPQWIMGALNYNYGLAKYGGYHLLVQASGVVTAFCSSTSFTGNGHHYRTGNTTVNDGGWHHLALSWTPSAAVKLYIDGIEDSYSTDFPGGSYPSSMAYPASSDLYLGCLRYTGGSYLSCATVDIADAFVCSVPLTAAEIKEIYRKNRAWTYARGLEFHDGLLGPLGTAPTSYNSAWRNIPVTASSSEWMSSYGEDHLSGGQPTW